MKLIINFIHLAILISILSIFTTASPTMPPPAKRSLTLTLPDLPNPFAAISTAQPGAPAPTTQRCACTVVFGDKTSINLNTTVGSTNGISGQATLRKACTAQLLVGTGCSAAIASESDNQCVRSQACTTA